MPLLLGLAVLLVVSGCGALSSVSKGTADGAALGASIAEGGPLALPPGPGPDADTGENVGYYVGVIAGALAAAAVAFYAGKRKGAASPGKV